MAVGARKCAPRTQRVVHVLLEFDVVGEELLDQNVHGDLILAPLLLEASVLEGEVLLGVGWRRAQHDEVVIHEAQEQGQHRVRDSHRRGDLVLTKDEERDATGKRDHNLDRRVGDAARHGSAASDLFKDAVERSDIHLPEQGQGNFVRIVSQLAKIHSHAAQAYGVAARARGAAAAGSIG